MNSSFENPVSFIPFIFSTFHTKAGLNTLSPFLILNFLAKLFQKQQRLNSFIFLLAPSALSPFVSYGALSSANHPIQNLLPEGALTNPVSVMEGRV